MLESRAKLEQILELLLSEDTDRAEELLHEYVVSKARAEYERVLESEDEDEDDEDLDETIDQSNDFEDDITSDEDEIEADESGLHEEGEDEDMLDMGGEEGEEEGEEGEEEGEDDLEDKVDDLEAELADLRADFEKLMADEAGEEEHADLDLDSEDDDGEEAEDEFESFSYDLDEEIDEDSEVVEEATKLQDKVAAPKPGQDDSPKTYSAPKKRFQLGGQSVPKNHDGSDGDKGANKPKDNTPTDNIGIKPAKAKIQH